MAKPKNKEKDPYDDSVETGRLTDQSPRPVAASEVRPFTVDPLDPVHPLDRAPVNSKIVVTSLGAVFATPERVRKAEKVSLEGKLPEGTKIHKLAEGMYRGALPFEYGGAVVVFDNTNDVIAHLRKIVIGE
jgi:hypothetical protein